MAEHEKGSFLTMPIATKSAESIRKTARSAADALIVLLALAALAALLFNESLEPFL
ncbi:hypothetical protein ACIPF8_19195 [Collimonas sp. NPDC087041]|uniref:hypothetical protein n=1 Tax=Collimonas sp. NPDC087041 TaxID=3363960 RepID=UPI003829C391